MLKFIIKFLRFRIENLSIFFGFHSLKIYEFKELFKDVKIKNSDIILDFGCGNGFETLLVGKKCKKIYGIDIFKENLDKAKERSFFLRGKINSYFKLTRLEDAKFKSETFDKIISICVLEHIKNYFDVLKETYRIIKKGGQICFSVDSLETIDDLNFLKFHKRSQKVENYFNEQKLRDLLVKIGFKNIKIYPICRSEFVKNRFIKMIKNTTRLDNIISIMEYFKLRKVESRYKNYNKGLFLLFKGNK